MMDDYPLYSNAELLIVHKEMKVFTGFDITIGLDSTEFTSTFSEDGSAVWIDSGEDNLMGDTEPACRQWTESAFLITAPSDGQFVAAPEPSSAWLLATLPLFAFVLRNRR